MGGSIIHERKPAKWLTFILAFTLTETIVPVVIESEAVQDTFEWARFINENGIADEILNHPVVRLAEKLFNKHRLLDYHRILFDIPYREKLISE